MKEQRWQVGGHERDDFGEEGIAWSECFFCRMYITTITKSASEGGMAWHRQRAAAFAAAVVND